MTRRLLSRGTDPWLLDFGEKVKACRKALGLTQAEVAFRCVTDPGIITDIEAGRRDAKVSTLQKVCQAVGLSLDINPERN